MNDIIFIWIGKIVLLLLFIFFCLVMFWLIGHAAYACYDMWIKRLMGWNKLETRENVKYFIKHKDEITTFIKEQVKSK